MNYFTSVTSKHRLTEAEKGENDNEYYKAKLNQLDHSATMNASFINFGDNISDYKRMKVNYDLFNNIIDPLDFSYVCQPYGAEVGEMPAKLTNRDIVSGKIKVLLGMESRMPFDWRPIAVNGEATTRKEQEVFNRVRDYVVGDIMKPIRLKLEQQSAEQAKGQQLTTQEKQQLRADLEEQTKQQTPDEVIKYMAREHKDPAEVQSQQILEYLIQDQKIPDKFNKMMKHGLLSGLEVVYVGMINKRPVMKVINSLHFKHDKSPDLDCISEGEWATNEYRMTPSEVISSFPKLTTDEIDRIYEYQSNPSLINDVDWSFDSSRQHEGLTIRVLHGVWKGLRKIGFLTYTDKSDNEQLKIVDETYKLNRSQGDIEITWEWVPQTEECYKIMNDIFTETGPVIGQSFDIDNLYECRLPYYGGSCDALNSPMTAAMDRIKGYQYYFDIILYRIESLMASDKGKILGLNINAIPKSAGIDIREFLYFMEANHLAILNPQEEGKKGAVGGDVTNLMKEVDMSLVSDIMKYINIAEYIERKCGDAIGVTKQMEGQIAANDAVTNTKQNLVQSSYIVQPYFDFHNTIKRNALQALIDTAKAVYTLYPPGSLSYVLDDMSMKMLTVDVNLLSNSSIGIFVSNSTKAEEAKQAVQGLAQAALQNQQAELGDIIKVIKANSINEAEEAIEVAQNRRKLLEQASEKAKQEMEKEAQEAQEAHEEKQWAHEKDMVITKEKERRKTEIQKQTILSLGFSKDTDVDDDGTPDVLEVAKFGVDADIQERHQTLEENKFAHQQENDAAKNEIEKKKLAIAKAKPKTS